MFFEEQEMDYGRYIELSGGLVREETDSTPGQVDYVENKNIGEEGEKTLISILVVVDSVTSLKSVRSMLARGGMMRVEW